MEFTIKRSGWLRGEGEENSFLLREKDGKKCCLGFYLEACKVKLEQLKNLQGPSELAEKSIPKSAKWLICYIDDDNYTNSSNCYNLMMCNDSELEIPREQISREHKITGLFADQDIIVHFID